MTTVEPTPGTADPAMLLVDLNIREARMDKDFLAFIKDHGVIEPIVAVRTEDGGSACATTTAARWPPSRPARSWCRFHRRGRGQRRGRAHRPAVDENKHRLVLTNAEEVSAVDQPFRRHNEPGLALDERVEAVGTGVQWTASVQAKLR